MTPFDPDRVAAMRAAADALPFPPIAARPTSEALWVDIDRALVITTDAQAAGAWAYAATNGGLPTTVHGVGEFVSTGETLFAALVSLETDDKGRFIPPELPPPGSPVASVPSIDAPEDLVTAEQLDAATERAILSTPHYPRGVAAQLGLLSTGVEPGIGRFFILE